MSKLFDYNNPVWQFVGKVADFAFLTVLWALCSSPIVTIGASTTALYYVMFKVSEDKEGYLFKTFAKAFKENLKQTMPITIIMFLFGLFLGIDLFYYYHVDTQSAKVLFWVILVFSIVYVFMLTLIFPLTARLETTVKNLFLMSFMVSIKNFSWVMLMVVTTVCVVAFSIFVFWPVLIIAAGLIAWIHSIILIKVIFPKYKWNEEDREKG